MENGDTKNGQSNTPGDLPGTAPKTQTRKERGKASGGAAKPRKQQKKSLWRHWKSASRAKQVKWFAEGIVVATGVLILGVYIWGNLQTKWNFQAEHKPIVIHSRPPSLIQSISCDPQTQSIHMGNWEQGVKNIGNVTARDVFPLTDLMKFIPDKKTGDPLADDPPILDCNIAPDKNKLMFALSAGEEKFVQFRQTMGTTPKINSGDAGQFYISTCVSYSDNEGNKHATCDMYRLFVFGSNPLDHVLGTPTWKCDGKEITGHFVSAPTGNCQN